MRSSVAFVGRTTAVHVVTYFLVGLVASNLLDYRWAFEQPVIRDYMVPFGSTAVFLGPVLQVVRGLIFGLVLLPFRHVIATRLGWLWLWALVVGIGILSTPAAAPSSVEGLVYTRLPLWYHAFGLPEMLLQTFIFCVLVWAYTRYPRGLLSALPPVAGTIVGSVASASFAFIGYAVVSVLFALAVGANLSDPSNLTIRTQGLFIAPFVLNTVLVFVLGRRLRSAVFVSVAYVTNALALLLYQWLVLGETSVIYVLLAPFIPALILAMTARMSRPSVVVPPVIEPDTENSASLASRSRGRSTPTS